MRRREGRNRVTGCTAGSAAVGQKGSRELSASTALYSLIYAIVGAYLTPTPNHSQTTCKLQLSLKNLSCGG